MILDEIDMQVLRENFDEETINEIDYYNVNRILDYLNQNGVYYAKDLFLSSLDLFLLPYDEFVARFDKLKNILGEDFVDILDIKLDDTFFLEAIKCYPKDRKYLNKCGSNCRKYLLRQLDIINPKVVLVLGDAAFKAILDVKYKKFSEVVGREFMLDNIKIIPIYHPSPISPLSLKGNIPIFEKLKEEL